MATVVQRAEELCCWDVILEKTLYRKVLAIREVAASFKTGVNNTLYIVILIGHDLQTLDFSKLTMF